VERGTLRRDEPGEGESLVARSLGSFSLYSRARRAERGTLCRDEPGEGERLVARSLGLVPCARGQGGWSGYSTVMNRAKVKDMLFVPYILVTCMRGRVARCAL
jgi:hypothetical protein